MRLKEFIALVIALALILGLMSLTGISCPIKAATGLSCPGCGMTRAWLSFLQGDLPTAFDYHPLFFLSAIYILIYLLRHNLPKKVFWALSLFALFAFAILYVLRMIDPTDVVVVCQPEESLFLRPWRSLF